MVLRCVVTVCYCSRIPLLCAMSTLYTYIGKDRDDVLDTDMMRN